MPTMQDRRTACPVAAAQRKGEVSVGEARTSLHIAKAAAIAELKDQEAVVAARAPRRDGQASL
jgi:hypothetical protein